MSSQSSLQEINASLSHCLKQVGHLSAQTTVIENSEQIFTDEHEDDVSELDLSPSSAKEEPTSEK
jgi:hypothetical protein